MEFKCRVQLAGRLVELQQTGASEVPAAAPLKNLVGLFRGWKLSFEQKQKFSIFVVTQPPFLRRELKGLARSVWVGLGRWGCSFSSPAGREREREASDLVLLVFSPPSSMSSCSGNLGLLTGSAFVCMSGDSE